MTTAENMQENQHELWKITLGELDEKLGVKVLEESAERVVATIPLPGTANRSDCYTAGQCWHWGRRLAPGRQ